MDVCEQDLKAIESVDNEESDPHVPEAVKPSRLPVYCMVTQQALSRSQEQLCDNLGKDFEIWKSNSRTLLDYNGLQWPAYLSAAALRQMTHTTLDHFFYSSWVRVEKFLKYATKHRNKRYFYNVESRKTWYRSMFDVLTNLHMMGKMALDIASNHEDLEESHPVRLQLEVDFWEIISQFRQPFENLMEFEIRRFEPFHRLKALEPKPVS